MMSDRKTISRLERLAAMVAIDPVTGCHNWIGSVRTRGYGRTSVGGKSVYTHRLAYELARGPIPNGMVIDHLCRNRRCCNPDHLEVVTNRENIRRGIGITATIKTHCPQGHPYDAENTRINRRGKKVCRACSWAPYAAKTNANRRAKTAAARSPQATDAHPLNPSETNHG